MHNVRYNRPKNYNPDRFNQAQSTTVHRADPPMEWKYFTYAVTHVQYQCIHS